MDAFLTVFASIYCPLIQAPKQAHTSMHTISFIAHLQYFLRPHLGIKTQQTFITSGKLVQTGEYPDSAAWQALA